MDDEIDVVNYFLIIKHFVVLVVRSENDYLAVDKKHNDNNALVNSNLVEIMV